MRPVILLASLFLFCATGVYAADKEAAGEDFSKGPLFGKNLYIPFLIHYNFPSLPAKSGTRSDFRCHISMYYSNDARYEDLMPEYDERQYNTIHITRDYESWVLELGLAYNVFGNLQFGMDFRWFTYYGGFLDPLIEKFHDTFRFPPGLRQYFLQNQLYINIPNDNGITLYLDAPASSLGDIDFWGKWTLLENRPLSFAAMAAYKIPTGNLASLSGSGSSDAAFGLLLDYRPGRFVTLYAQAGLVWPFNGKSYPMYSGLLGLEFHPWDFLSLNAQAHFRTSPISDNTVTSLLNRPLGKNLYQYSLPQTNIVAGARIHHKGFALQLYIEEDPITNQGTDITFCMMLSYTFNIGNFKE